MNFSKEFTYRNKLLTDEVSSVDYQKLCKLGLFLTKLKSFLRRNVVDVSMTIPVSVEMIA